jgi:hypothetical protein
LDTNTKNEPSGASAGSESAQRPENGWTSGWVQPSLRRCDATMAPLAVKYTVSPAGVNAGGLVITPGANSTGTGTASVAACGGAAVRGGDGVAVQLDRSSTSTRAQIAAPSQSIA